MSQRAQKNTILTSHGRPAWYGQDGVPIGDAFVVGIAGGSASGKTHVAQQIVRALDNTPNVVILSQDSFYKRLNAEENALAHQNLHDLDHPNAVDTPLLAECLADLKKGWQTNIPIYSFAQHQRLDKTKYLYGASIIITEGILALHEPTLRPLYDLKIFVQCDSDLMLARRLKRDIAERGRSVDGTLDQYLRFVKPAYDNFVLPSARYADIIVPGHENAVAIDLIGTHVKRKLSERRVRFRERMAQGQLDISQELPPHVTPLEEIPNVICLPATPQLKGIYTILRDKTSSRADFIFFADRLATLVIEKAMDMLPFAAVRITTPIEAEMVGKRLSVPHASVCGISIIRSGGPLEQGLRRVMGDVALGAMLIQTENKTTEPLLLHSMLPVCIQDRKRAKDAWVFLLDAQIGTGASALMAIRILLDHGVQENRIIFACFLVAKNGGVKVIQQAFPGVRIITGAADDGICEEVVGNDGEDWRVWSIEPGMGHIGNRYYLN